MHSGSFSVQQPLGIEVRDHPDNLVFELFEWHFKIVIETDIVLPPRLRPEIRRLAELLSLLEESVGPFPVLLFLVFPVVKDDGTQITNVVVETNSI